MVKSVFTPIKQQWFTAISHILPYIKPAFFIVNPHKTTSNHFSWLHPINYFPRLKEELRRRRNSGSLGSTHSARSTPRSSGSGPSYVDYAGSRWISDQNGWISWGDFDSWEADGRIWVAAKLILWDRNMMGYWLTNNTILLTVINGIRWDYFFRIELTNNLDNIDDQYRYPFVNK